MFKTRLCFRNDDTHVLLMSQDFDKTFKTVKQAEKFLEGRVAGMKSHSLEPQVTIYGQVLNVTGYPTIEKGIALF
jgi:hypothetical protein